MNCATATQRATGEADWLDVATARLKKRNEVQTDPFLTIFNSNTKMFYELARLQKQQNDMKRKVAEMQYETSQLLSEACSGGGDSKSAPAIEKLKDKLSVLQGELREKQTSESNERMLRLDLSKKVRDQNKLLVDQAEEIKIAKDELKEAHVKISQLEEEVAAEQRSREVVCAEIESLRETASNAEKRLQGMEAENASLVERILTEKRKTADDLNEMNSLVDGVKGIVGGGISFLKSTASDLIAKRASSSRSSETENAGTFPIDAESDKGEDLPLPPISEIALPKHISNIVNCHKGAINDLKSVNDGRHFITSGSDSYVRLFDIAALPSPGVVGSSASTRSAPPMVSQPNPLLSLLSTGPLICLDVSAPVAGGSEWVVSSCSSDNSCRIWSLRNKSMRHHLTGHSNKILAVKFLSQGSNRLVTGSADRTLRVWDIESKNGGAIIAIKAGSSTCSLNLDPSHTSFASGHQDGGLRFWDLSTGNQIHFLPKLHTEHITSVQYCPSHLKPYEVLTSSRDGTLSITDTRTYRTIVTMRSPRFRPACDWSRSSFSPDGRYVAAGGKDGVVIIWDALTGNPEIELDPSSSDASSPAVPIASVSWGSTGGVACDKNGRVLVFR